MPQFDKQLVYAVNRDNEAAWRAVMKIAGSAPLPGQLIPLSHEEFTAIKDGVFVLKLPEPECGCVEVDAGGCVAVDRSNCLVHPYA